MSVRGTQRATRNTGIIRAAKNVPCADCGQRYPYYVMDFDHREEKSTNVGWMRGCGRARLEAEIAKCDVVCANCHRERSFGPNAKTPTAGVPYREFQLDAYKRRSSGDNPVRHYGDDSRIGTLDEEPCATCGARCRRMGWLHHPGEYWRMCVASQMDGDGGSGSCRLPTIEDAWKRINAEGVTE